MSNRAAGLLVVLLSFFSSLTAQPLQVVGANRQHKFPAQVPPGNYSGLAFLGGNHYAMVSDKGDGGFFFLDIDVDSLSGDITRVGNFRFVASAGANRDNEGVCFMPDRRTLFVSGEADHRVVEYRLDGQPTGRELQVPPVFRQAWPNYSLESLTYSPVTHQFWTTSESTLRGDGTAAAPQHPDRNRLRLQSFSFDGQPLRQYAYLMDAPTVSRPARNYALGVCGLAALDDGRLLVLERELFVPKKKIGGFVRNKIYVVDPRRSEEIGQGSRLTGRSPYMAKTLLHEWRTRLNLLHQDFANYEGLCLGPRLADGSRVLLLCADSQDQYGGLLRDWFMTIVVR